MSNPAAPLEKAVEEARKALDESHECSSDHEVCCLCGAHGVHDALFNLLAALDADRGEAEAIVRTIVENHFARITERGVLVYGQPVADTGFAAAIHWLARREGKGENRES